MALRKGIVQSAWMQRISNALHSQPAITALEQTADLVDRLKYWKLSDRSFDE